MRSSAFDEIVADLECGYRADAQAALSAWLRAAGSAQIAEAFETLAAAWNRLDPAGQFYLLLRAIDVLRVSRSDAVSVKLAQLETLLARRPGRVTPRRRGTR
jgi:putative heme degradation protein